ncbi:MAG: hypothetical protein WCJ45_08285 [bacterium]
MITKDYSKKHSKTKKKEMETEGKKRGSKKYKLLLDKNDKGNATVCQPSFPEKIIDRIKKETGHTSNKV